MCAAYFHFWGFSCSQEVWIDRGTFSTAPVLGAHWQTEVKVLTQLSCWRSIERSQVQKRWQTPFGWGPLGRGVLRVILFLVPLFFFFWLCFLKRGQRTMSSSSSCCCGWLIIIIVLLLDGQLIPPLRIFIGVIKRSMNQGRHPLVIWRRASVSHRCFSDNSLLARSGLEWTAVVF